VGLKGYVDTRFNSSTANVANIVSSIATLVSNAASQAGDLTQLYSDRDAHTTLISGLQSQLTANASTVNTLRANVGSFYTWANTNFGTSNYSNATVAAYLPTSTVIQGINANITAANSAIAEANVAMKAYVDANAAVQSTQIVTANTAMKGYVDAQITSTQGQITTANTAMRVYVDANAAVQSANIAALVANAASQSSDIATLYSTTGIHTTQITNIQAVAMVSNIARFTWIANVAPLSTQGNIGDIWYQTY
jgi:hypothetical protein